MPTTRGRIAISNSVIYDQADFFSLDGYTHVHVGLPDLVLQVYHQNILLPWDLVSGVGVIDSGVVAGHVFAEALASGAISLRWRPNAVGYWRLLLGYTAGHQLLAQDYDVTPAGASGSVSGLKVSFTKPGVLDDC